MTRPPAPAVARRWRPSRALFSFVAPCLLCAAPGVAWRGAALLATNFVARQVGPTEFAAGSTGRPLRRTRRARLLREALRSRAQQRGVVGGRRPFASPRGRDAGSKTALRGLLEQAVFGGVTYAVMTLMKPKAAPGPSDELRTRQQRAEEELAKARALAAEQRAKFQARLLEQTRDELKRVKREKEDQEWEEVLTLAKEEEEAELRRRAEKAAAGAEAEAAKSEEEQGVADALKRLQEVEAELEAAEEDLRQYPLPPFLQEAANSGSVMIAVTGGSGVGKSSWINAIRKLRDRDPGAAKVGVNETTTEPVMHTFPGRVGMLYRAKKIVKGALSYVKGSNEEAEDPIQAGDRVMLRNLGEGLDGTTAQVVCESGADKWEVQLEDGTSMTVARTKITGVLKDCVLWDLPGVGTPRFPQDTYVKSMGIRHFDMVVLLTASRFTEAELMLVKELEYWNVPYFLVRNKADVDVDSEIDQEEDDDEPMDEAHRDQIEKRTIAKIKDFFHEKFSFDKVYCISTRRKLRNQYDFRQLEEDMEAALKQQRGVTEP